MLSNNINQSLETDYSMDSAKFCGTITGLLKLKLIFSRGFLQRA